MRRSMLVALVALLALSAVSLAAGKIVLPTLDDTGSESFAPKANLSVYKVKPVIEESAGAGAARSTDPAMVEVETEESESADASVALALMQPPPKPNAVAFGMEDVKRISAAIVSKFNAWRVKFAKQYNVGEATRRLAIFAANVRKIMQLNGLGEQGEFSTETPFADLTEQEFRATALGSRPPQIKAAFLQQDEKFEAHEGDVLFEMSEQRRAELESAVIDWRSISSPVKDQRSCGSCWAHTAVSVLESVWRKSGKAMQPLSVQQLLDCDTATQLGCQGGDPSVALDYLTSHGSVPESWYKYTNKQGPCKAASGKGPKVASLGLAVPQCMGGTCPGQYKQEVALIEALRKYGPLSVLMSAIKLQFWTKGVITNKSGCSNHWDTLDHAVVLVGYNPHEKTWLIRNSWSSKWGEKGYFRMQYGYNTCGLANYVIYATV